VPSCKDPPFFEQTSYTRGRKKCRKIRLIEGNAKGHHIKKIDLSRDFAAGVSV
jgi:hypothetical protein